MRSKKKLPVQVRFLYQVWICNCNLSQKGQKQQLKLQFKCNTAQWSWWNLYRHLSKQNTAIGIHCGQSSAYTDWLNFVLKSKYSKTATSVFFKLHTLPCQGHCTLRDQLEIRLRLLTFFSTLIILLFPVTLLLLKSEVNRWLTNPFSCPVPTPRSAKFFSISQPIAPQPT